MSEVNLPLFRGFNSWMVVAATYVGWWVKVSQPTGQWQSKIAEWRRDVFKARLRGGVVPLPPRNVKYIKFRPPKSYTACNTNCASLRPEAADKKPGPWLT
jgi:hypothetical protein